VGRISLSDAWVTRLVAGAMLILIGDHSG